jgi:hypothetical protein
VATAQTKFGQRILQSGIRDPAVTRLEKSVRQFENVAAQTDALRRGDPKGGNMHAKRYIQAFNALASLGLGACKEVHREVYEIPPGLRGWVHVDVDMPECAPLDVRDNSIYFHIAPNGRGCTSGVPPSGAMKGTYVVLDKDRTPLPQTGWGFGGLIWGGHNIILLERNHKRYLCSFGFFVGTEEEFKRSGGDSPSNERCSPREADPARDSRL